MPASLVAAFTIGLTAPTSRRSGRCSVTSNGAGAETGCACAGGAIALVVGAATADL
jgi:hypothetical protein